MKIKFPVICQLVGPPNRREIKLFLILQVVFFSSCYWYSECAEGNMKEGIDSSFYRKYVNGKTIRRLEGVRMVRECLANGFSIRYYPSGNILEKGQYYNGVKKGDFYLFDTLKTTCIQNWENHKMLSLRTADGSFVLDMTKCRISKKNTNLSISLDTAFCNATDDLMSLHTYDTLIILKGKRVGVILNRKLNYLYDFSEEIKTSKLDKFNWNFTIVEDQFNVFDSKGNSFTFKIK